jgi:colanic acid/amylovoran biosynthesis protein
MRKALDRCALFIARDDHSLDHLKTLGRGESKLALCPDVALLFGDHSREELPEREDGLCVGASLMRWQNYPVDGERGHAAYLNGMQAALQQLLGSDPGLRVRLYPTNAAFGANPMDDVAVVAEMYRRLSADGFGDRCTAVAWTANPETFMRDVAQCDLFVATRMHSAIMALNAGVAVAGVAYEEKMHGLLNLFELGDFVVDIQSPESIPDLVLRAYERRKEIRSQVWRGGPAVRKEAFRAMDLVAEVVGQRELEKTAPR